MSAETNNTKTLTLEQQEVLDIDEVLRQFQFNVWGHGTSSDEPGSFFEEGIRKGQHPSLMATAYPIDQSNITTLDDWPHKKYREDPNIVLLGIPFADPENGITYRDIDSFIFTPTVKQADGGNQHIFPSKYIIGYYDTSAKDLIPNPHFDINSDSHTEAIEEVRHRKLEDQSQANMVNSYFAQPVEQAH